MRILLNVVWIAGIIYATIPAFWLAIHPFTKFWRSRQSGVYRWLGSIWLAEIFAAAAITHPLMPQRLYSTPFSWIAFAVLAWMAISVYRRVGRGFSRDTVIGRVELEPQQHEQKLVTTGMHGRVRHPLYLAHFFMLTALTAGSGLAALYAMWGFAILTGALMVRFEEVELERRFGDAYREYKRRVPAIFPRASSGEGEAGGDGRGAGF